MQEEQLGGCFRSTYERQGSCSRDEVRLCWKDIRLEGKTNGTWWGMTEGDAKTTPTCVTSTARWAMVPDTEMANTSGGRPGLGGKTTVVSNHKRTRK